jgi:TPR repeat protein
MRNVRSGKKRTRNRGIAMARFEMADLESAVLGQSPATADSFYELGIKYSVGADVAADFVSAHKWFNLAAMRGNKDAITLRQEIAASMSPSEIAEAQRAARAWLTAH